MNSVYELRGIGRRIKAGRMHYNLDINTLIETAREKEGAILAKNGALCVNTGKYTGRSPKDRFIVDEPSVNKYVDWNESNRPIGVREFENLLKKAVDYMEGKEIYVFDGYIGADPDYRMPVRVYNEFAFQNLFAQQMFIKHKDRKELEDFIPEFTLIALPDLKAVPSEDGTNSEVFIIISFEKRLILIGGSRYCGEIKKSIFTVMNYLLPFRGVMPMHCSANVGPEGDVALFFGLSGTGKTTLSADYHRKLIGDDEHGWTQKGIFNFEGGCYAKCINLSKEREPQIWNAIRRGALLENVVIDGETGLPDYDDSRYTENTRAAFPLEHMEDAILDGVGGIPKTIIFLTADATGVLPPISRLSKEEAMYHFISGYTSKLAGTERGVIEPEATFSTCFGAPFMILHPQVYAQLLGERIEKHQVKVFLVNTGWTGGPYGVGHRMKLEYTRTMIRAAMKGDLDNVAEIVHPIFKLRMPTQCPGVPSELLNPSNTWGDPTEYNRKALELAKHFHENFLQFKDMPEDIKRVNQRMLDQSTPSFV